MKNSKLKLLLILSILSFLTACANKDIIRMPSGNLLNQQRQIDQITHWSVKGRIAVTTPVDKFSSNYSWQHAPLHQELMLYGTFGTTYAHLVHKPHFATLTLSDKETFRSNDVSSLVEKTLGYPFPIEKMQYWFKGLPHPDSNNELKFDELGYLKSINQEQWTITYKKYKPFGQFKNIMLPTKITITDGKITIKLSNRNWKTGTDL